MVDRINGEEKSIRSRVEETVDVIVNDPDNLPTEDQLSDIHRMLNISDTLSDANAFIKGEYSVDGHGTKVKKRVDTNKSSEESTSDNVVDAPRVVIDNPSEANKEEIKESKQQYIPEPEPVDSNKVKTPSMDTEGLEREVHTNDQDEEEVVYTNSSRPVKVDKVKTQEDLNSTVVHEKIIPAENIEAPALAEVKTDNRETFKAVSTDPEKHRYPEDPEASSYNTSKTLETVDTTHTDKKIEAPSGNGPTGFKKFSTSDINLDEITFVENDSGEESVIKNITEVGQMRPRFETTLFQSGYSAEFQALTFYDLSSVLTSRDETYTSFYNIYRTYYNSMVSTNLGGRMEFTDFLSNTALTDVDSIDYALYAATYPEESKFDFTCAYCEELNESVSVTPSDLQQIRRSDAMVARENTLSKANINRNNLAEYSGIKEVKRILLEDSGYVIDVRIPTLRNNLDLMGNLEKTPDNEEAFQFMRFVSAVAVPDIQTYNQTGDLKYIRSTNYDSIYRILYNLSIDDTKKLATSVADFSMQYTPTYGIAEHTCEFCGKINHDITIDMDELVFSAALQRIAN